MTTRAARSDQADAVTVILVGVAQLLAVAAVMHLAWSFLRGRFFSAAVVRDLTALGWIIFIGALAVLFLDHLGRNGVLAALGSDGGEPLHPLEFWASAPHFWLGATAIGLLAVAFRRGARLQRDTEGLV